MAINLRNPEVEGALRALAAEAGESLTEAASIAFRERLKRLRDAKKRLRSLQSVHELINEGRAGTRRSDSSLKQLADELWGDE
jgi:hypothetical protein